MIFPPPWAMARLGEAFADQRNAETITQYRQQSYDWQENARQWEEYARSLQQKLIEQRDEYFRIMQYAHQLRTLYMSKAIELQEQYGIDLPMPPGGFVTSLNARVTDVKFFESGSEIPPVESRSYGDRFPRSSAKYIICECDLFSLPPADTIEAPVLIRWYLVSGSGLFHSIEHTIQILPELEHWQFANGCGWDVPGKWAVGRYEVQIFMMEEFAAQGQFEIF